MIASDEESAFGAAVIMKTVARTLFPNTDPLGMNITVPLTGGTFTVVGTVAATKSGISLSAAPRPRVYYLAAGSIQFLDDRYEYRVKPTPAWRPPSVVKFVRSTLTCRST